MTIALVHKHYDEKHLDEVKEKMTKLGAPIIKAVWHEAYGHYVALEGCHRIRAAKELGLTPVINELDYDEVFDMDVTDPKLGLDLDISGVTVGDICYESYNSVVVEFCN